MEGRRALQMCREGGVPARGAGRRGAGHAPPALVGGPRLAASRARQGVDGEQGARARAPRGEPVGNRGRARAREAGGAREGAAPQPEARVGEEEEEPRRRWGLRRGSPRLRLLRLRLPPARQSGLGDRASALRSGRRDGRAAAAAPPAAAARPRQPRQPARRALEQLQPAVSGRPGSGRRRGGRGDRRTGGGECGRREGRARARARPEGASEGGRGRARGEDPGEGARGEGGGIARISGLWEGGRLLFVWCVGERGGRCGEASAPLSPSPALPPESGGCLEWDPRVSPSPPRLSSPASLSLSSPPPNSRHRGLHLLPRSCAGGGGGLATRAGASEATFPRRVSSPFAVRVAPPPSPPPPRFG